MTRWRRDGELRGDEPLHSRPFARLDGDQISAILRPAEDDEPAPVPLDPDLLALAEGVPANIVQQIYQEQAERDRLRRALPWNP